MNLEKELKPLKEVLQELRKEGEIPVALLYGSYARGTPHKRSDIDLAVFIRARDEKEETDIIDKFLNKTRIKTSRNTHCESYNMRLLKEAVN